ncbi:sensor histidine kinase [Jannaschia formosa]|uniref:sensor histidine kinase n=1 Tax=Jannaschia formosa TaxID=2259592 RepID=UPI000E1C343D|nr:sensor histidine kinase [Jannaschia formosa]TFL19233.1 sensor histidine kinase [Jannaschia formosa]
MQPGEDDASGGQSFFRGLRFRVAAFLALSLLPLGLVMILQTQALSEAAQRREELTLLSMTRQAAHGERTVAERALGAAEALTVVLDLLADDPDACRDYLSSYIERSDRYSFVGFIGDDGVMNCASAGGERDYSSGTLLADLREAPRSYISRLDAPDVSKEPVINVLRPVRSETALRGFVSVSIPLRFTAERSDLPADQTPLSLLTFNTEGEILTAETQAGQERAILPDGLDLSDLVGVNSLTFDRLDTDGVPRTFAVIPLVPNLLYGLAAWPREEHRTTFAGIPLPASLLPILMFAASIAVSYFAVDRLVVRHIGALRKMMKAFAQRRALPSRENRTRLPAELQDLERGFVEMALDLANDEARMEDALREKNVLLKEIHHRVKNNLQLISSIMNMQIRAARHEETVGVLRRLQERVLGLAAVHRNLYQTDDLSRSDAGRLLDDLFKQLISMSADAREDIVYTGTFDEVILYPDQALPLSLLASELGTNALKHLAAPPGEKPVVAASLRLVDEGVAELVCENSVLPGTVIDEKTSSGLGARLIRAFASQLGGKVETLTEGGRHRVSMQFKVEAFSQTPEDY